jgi:hypothetical protein
MEYKSLHKAIFGQEHAPSKEENILNMIPSDVNIQLFEKTITNILNIDPDYNFKNFYKLNSYKLRSDEFTRDHNGLHLLFAGCSQTFGAGTEIKDLWSFKVYNKISETEKTSGFFNIAVPGISITETIFQIFCYFKKFGYPDHLFINFPDFSREAINIFAKKNRANKSLQSLLDDTALARNLLGQYTMLKDICRQNNVNVHEMTWYSENWTNLLGAYDLKNYFSNVYVPSNEEIFDHCSKFVVKNPKKQMRNYYETALDGRHQGIAYQDFWYNKMYQIYNEKV